MAFVSFTYGIGLFGSTYLLPIFLQAALSYSPSASGLVLLPAGLALAATMLPAGQLAGFVAPSWLVSIGVLLLSLSLAFMSSISSLTPYAILVLGVVVGRIGLGLALPSLSLGSLRAIAPGDVPQATSVINFTRQLGGAIGVSLVGVLLEWRLRVYGITGLDPRSVAAEGRPAFQEVFIVLALVCVSAAAVALFMAPSSRSGSNEGA